LAPTLLTATLLAATLFFTLVWIFSVSIMPFFLIRFRSFALRDSNLS
jgi:hypothetical protein